MVSVQSMEVPVRRGRPPRINRDQVLDAAIALADAQGLDALTLRGVARAVGVAPVSLYTYVSSSEELLDLVVARVIERNAQALTWPSAWDGVLELFCHRLRDLLLAHPLVLETYRRRPVQTGPALDAAEVLLRALCEAGLDLETAVSAYGAAHAFVIGYAAVHQGREQRSRAVQDVQYGDIPDLLDADRHATLIRASAHMAGYHVRPDNFDQAVRWFIAGLRGDIGAAAATPAARGTT